jgi:hypothetical protein
LLSMLARPVRKLKLLIFTLRSVVTWGILIHLLWVFFLSQVVSLCLCQILHMFTFFSEYAVVHLCTFLTLLVKCVLNHFFLFSLGLVMTREH